jgi:hypothetical protein
MEVGTAVADLAKSIPTRSTRSIVLLQKLRELQRSPCAVKYQVPVLTPV